MPETIEYAPRSGAKLRNALLIIAALAMAGAAVYWKFRIVPFFAANAGRIEVLEKKTAELSQQLQALSSRPAAAPVAQTVMQPSDAIQIKALEDKLNALSQSLLESGNVKGTIVELGGKFRTLEAAQQSAEARLRNLITRLTIFYRLGDAVRSGNPYTAELAQMEEFATDQQALRAQLERLKPYADTGIPESWQLKQDFTAAVHTAFTPGIAVNTPFKEKFLAGLKRLVVIRKVGAAENEAGPKAAIARAEAHMDHQETEAALAEIEDLNEPYKSAFGDWVEAAHFTLAVPEMLLAVQHQLIDDAYLAPPSATAPKP